MSLLFADSFDGIVAGANKWSTWHGSNTVSTSFGRNGSQGLLPASSAAAAVAHLLDSQPASAVYGGWVYRDAAVGSDSLEQILGLISTNGTDSMRVRWAGDNRLMVNDVAVGTAGYAPPFTWLFIEAKATFGTGYELRVNGVVVASGALAGTGNIASVRSSRIAAAFWLEDLYVTDGNFLGPIQITNIKPSANGNRSELDGSDGNSVDNFALVNDGNDATYVESSVAGEGDSYAFGDLTSPEDVLGTVLAWRAFDPLGGGDSMKPLTRSGTTDYFGATEVLTGSALTYINPRDVDPDTAAAWTVAGVNAAQFGAEAV